VDSSVGATAEYRERPGSRIDARRDLVLEHFLDLQEKPMFFLPRLSWADRAHHFWNTIGDVATVALGSKLLTTLSS